MNLEDGSNSPHDRRRDHVLRGPLEEAISSVETSDPKELAEVVLMALDQQKIISYASRDLLAILSPAGRVMVLVAEKPQSTLREMSVILGVNESTVAKSVGKLVAANVIARTKVAGRNVYSINREVARNHPDIRRYNDAVLNIVKPDNKTD